MCCGKRKVKEKRKQMPWVIRRMKKPITTRAKSRREAYLRAWRNVVNIIWGYVVWGVRGTIRWEYCSCEELTHWKRPWCWEGLEAGGEGDNRGWDGWISSLTWWTWVWANSGSWWWTGRPGVLPFMGSQRVGHDWATEVNWTDKTWS